MYENQFESKDYFQKVKEMKIRLNGSDLVIKKGEQNQYCHTYETNSEKIPSTKLYNENEIFEYEEMDDFSLSGKGQLEIILGDIPETITIVNESGDVFLDEMKLGALESEVKSGNIKGKNLKINHVDLKTASGDIKIQGYLDSDVKINLQTKSGDIKIDKIGSPMINCESDSGDVKLTECNSMDTINVGSKSGDLKFDNFIEGKEITLTTLSGSIKSKRLKSTNSSVSSSSGDIKFDELESDKTNITTASGEIKINSPNADDLKINTKSGEIKLSNYDVEKGTYITVSGEIKIYTKDEDYKIIAETKTGEINIFKKDYYENALFGDSDREIKARTTSGEIKISVK